MLFHLPPSLDLLLLLLLLLPLILPLNRSLWPQESAAIYFLRKRKVSSNSLALTNYCFLCLSCPFVTFSALSRRWATEDLQQRTSKFGPQPGNMVFSWELVVVQVLRPPSESGLGGSERDNHTCILMTLPVGCHWDKSLPTTTTHIKLTAKLFKSHLCLQLTCLCPR